MSINRNNYEEYFILYTDNELSPAERMAVEQFVQENPDMQAELQLFLQTKLPEEEVVFADKASLLKAPETPVWEEWMLLEIDGELDTNGRLQLEEIMKSNPVARRDWETLQQTRLQADTSIVFPDKASLYRKEHSTRVVFMRRIRIAAAAVLLLAIGATTVQYMRSSDETTDSSNSNTLAKGGQVQTGGQRSNTDGPVLIKESNDSNDQTAPSEQQAVPDQQQPVQYASGIQQQRQATNPVQQQTPGVDNSNVAQQQDLANNQTNALPRPGLKLDDAPSIMRGNESIAGNDNKKLEKNISPVTFASNQPSQISNPADEALIADASENGGKKNKFRGFFRKVTRNFEKKTNIDVTDGQDQLLIAGFAIKM